MAYKLESWGLHPTELGKATLWRRLVNFFRQQTRPEMTNNNNFWYLLNRNEIHSVQRNY